jgi:hypothetical protein
MKLYAKINSGAAGIIWAIGFFVMLGLVAISKAIATQYPIAVAGWTGGLVSILLKNNANNRLDLEAAKSSTDTVENLNAIKKNSEAPPVSSKVTD